MRAQGRTGWRRWTLRLGPWLGAVLLFWTAWCIFSPGIPGLFEPRPLPAYRLPAGFDTVIIDPGHGGNDTGASGHGLQEKKISLDLALRLTTELHNLGFRVVLTREDDTYVSLPDRIRVAQAVPAAIFISLHCNYARNTNAHGFEIYRAESKSPAAPAVAQTTAASEPLAIAEGQLAEAIRNSFSDGLRCDRDVTKTANFFVLRNLAMPALLIECGFLTNPGDARALADPAFRARLAEAIARGIASYHSSVSPPAAQQAIMVDDHSGKAGEPL